ncbi:MAG: hypothetical protein EBE86_019890 [Hormoscilla sp. GUM202]|nr:hypothetical protein [Hormoscilla sp. GUM202]
MLVSEQNYLTVEHPVVSRDAHPDMGGHSWLRHAARSETSASSENKITSTETKITGPIPIDRQV